MKISIDTKEDSPEDIKKLIRMLLALIGEGSSYGERTPPSTGEGLFDMFGDPTASTAEQQQIGKDNAGGSGMDINEFIDNAEESSSQKPGSDDDEEFKVVPY